MELQRAKELKPGMAMLRSFVLPGWGHYYARPDNWKNGKYHMAGDLLMLAAYLGIDRRAATLDDNLVTAASNYAGANLKAHGRDYELAVANYDNIGVYNERQLELRNWNDLLPETQEYTWNWNSEEDRQRYSSIRKDRDRFERQLPALLSLMVANRVISAISSYVWTRNTMQEARKSSTAMRSATTQLQAFDIRLDPASRHVTYLPAGEGVMASITWRF